MGLGGQPLRYWFLFFFSARLTKKRRPQRPCGRENMMGEEWKLIIYLLLYVFGPLKVGQRASHLGGWGGANFPLPNPKKQRHQQKSPTLGLRNGWQLVVHHSKPNRPTICSRAHSEIFEGGTLRWHIWRALLRQDDPGVPKEPEPPWWLVFV